MPRKPPDPEPLQPHEPGDLEHQLAGLVSGSVRSEGWTDLSDGYRRGPWTVQVLAGTPRRVAGLRRTSQDLGRAVLADLDADYAELLAQRP